MTRRIYSTLLIFIFVACSVQATLAQTGVKSATGVTQSQSGAGEKLGSDDPSQYHFDDNIGALMVTLVFFGLFAIFYLKIRNAPSEKELKKKRKMKF